MSETKKTYLIAVRPDGDGGFLAHFPDFPEMVPDYGGSFEECVTQASRFLNDVIAYRAEHGRDLPEPSSVTEIRSLIKPEDGEVLRIVPVTVRPPSKNKRIGAAGGGEISPESTITRNGVI